MLSVRALSFGPSPQRLLVEGLSFELSPGQIGVVFGPSGAGKSTLLKLLTGEAFVFRGEVGWADEALTSKRRKLRIAYLEQSFPLFESASVVENVGVARLPAFGGLDSKTRARAVEVMNGLGLETIRPHQTVKTLSGGEAQRVALARAIVSDCPLILLDEPFSNLDGLNKTRAIGVIREHVDRRKAVAVVVAHDDFDALRLGDLLVHLVPGTAPAVRSLAGDQDLIAFSRQLGFAAPGGLQRLRLPSGQWAEFVATDVVLDAPTPEATGGSAKVLRVTRLVGGAMVSLRSVPDGGLFWAFTSNSDELPDHLRVGADVSFTIGTSIHHKELAR